uniref:Ig-like domain-containing protein n=1 Tax=Cyprinus carpio carpio TaxID=630221 RepID=A0A8C1B7T7_CYPCA
MLPCETEIHFYILKKILCEGVFTFEKHFSKPILFRVVVSRSVSLSAGVCVHSSGIEVFVRVFHEIVSLWWTFGGGTKLMLAGPTVKPSVSLLPPSSLQISGDSAALLCLLSSYSPQGALVSWTLDGSEVTEGVVTSAESEQDGRYSRSSVLTLSKARWED